VELPHAEVTFDFATGSMRFMNIAEWLFSAALRRVKDNLPKLKIPIFTRTIIQWLNLLVKVGFHLEQDAEPRPSDQLLAECPSIHDALIKVNFLHIRARKPG